MVWSLARGDEVCDAFRYAVAAGSVAVSAPGTELCGSGNVQALYAKVVMEAI